ncbi:TPA: hypothetical protein ACX6Q7_001797 [Photobacterium damselae]|uniref:hypothetical protein n=2 Tax=Photobacterium damselae TaxID=38293 RepID=UPI00254272A1
MLFKYVNSKILRHPWSALILMLSSFPCYGFVGEVLEPIPEMKAPFMTHQHTKECGHDFLTYLKERQKQHDQQSNNTEKKNTNTVDDWLVIE